jgi:hypothetical protein
MYYDYFFIVLLCGCVEIIRRAQAENNNFFPNISDENKEKNTLLFCSFPIQYLPSQGAPPAARLCLGQNQHNYSCRKIDINNNNDDDEVDGNYEAMTAIQKYHLNGKKKGRNKK